VPRAFSGEVEVNEQTPPDGTPVMAKNIRTGNEYWDPDGTQNGVYSLTVYGRVGDEVHMFVLGIRALIGFPTPNNPFVTIGTGDRTYNLSIEKAHLVAAITSHTGDETYSTEQGFDVTARVDNTGMEPATSVTATIAFSPAENAQVSPLEKEQYLGTIEPGEAVTVTWRVTCTASGLTEITVSPDGNTPAGTPGTGLGGTVPIPDQNLESDTVSVQQETKAHLKAGISAPTGEETYSTEQQFEVTATIQNLGEADALTTTATIDVVGGAKLVAGDETQEVGLIPGETTSDAVSWTLECTSTEAVTITVTPAGTDENTGAAVYNIESDTVGVQQESKAHLKADISAPTGGETYSTEQQFEVTATIQNLGEADALTTTATIDVVGGAKLVAGDKTQEIGLIAGETTSDAVSWTLECTSTEAVTIIVTPAGTDENTKVAIPDDNLDEASVTVQQEQKAHLKPDISAPTGEETYSTEQQFEVTATIQNLGEADALTTTATIDVVGGAKLVAGDKTQEIGLIAGEMTSDPVSWTLECTSTEAVTITVTPAGTDENTKVAIPDDNLDEASVTVQQETKAHLVGNISAPADVSIGQEFVVTATVENIGEADALTVTATIEVVGGAKPAEGQDAEQEIGTITGQTTSAAVIWTLECTSSGSSTITVTPAGTDKNTKAAIPGDNLDEASVTVNQQRPAHLVANITPLADVSIGQEFVVKATISNTGEADASDVTAVLSITGCAELAEDESLTHTIGIVEGESAEVTSWNVECTCSGTVTITVTPAGKDANSGWDAAAEPDQVTVNQQTPAYLVANITAPAEGDTFSVGQEFEVNATISNTGQAGARDVMATLSVTGGAELIADENHAKPVDTGTITGGESGEVTWTLICTSSGPVTITVTPEGMDANSAAAADVEPDSVTIKQLFTTFLPLVAKNYVPPPPFALYLPIVIKNF